MATGLLGFLLNLDISLVIQNDVQDPAKAKAVAVKAHQAFKKLANATEDSWVSQKVQKDTTQITRYC